MYDFIEIYKFVLVVWIQSTSSVIPVILQQIFKSTQNDEILIVEQDRLAYHVEEVMEGQ
jgi:hypothetical protein